MTRRHTAHRPDGFIDDHGVRVLCDACPRAATWRTRRTRRPVRYRCALCQHEHRDSLPAPASSTQEIR